ncbi:hypothetical protein L596_009132 [Steinernema carpocapsae]|uniref:Uncharacterized protein n=1 Tax=Steinernema carpocapsae TaxID=34508 RepID=A0A4U5PER5_STECR|nr:hypothetical protein L596_009132 [Steinernema carpocapsae]
MSRLTAKYTLRQANRCPSTFEKTNPELCDFLDPLLSSLINELTKGFAKTSQQNDRETTPYKSPLHWLIYPRQRTVDNHRKQWPLLHD